MSATLTQARDEIHDLFKSAWDADSEASQVQVLYWDTAQDVPTANDADGNPLPFARIYLQHSEGGQASLSGADGRRRWRRDGRVYVQIFTPFGTGLSMSDRLAMIALSAFEGATTPSGVWFREATVTEVGQSDSWFQTNVSAKFTYDQVK